MDDDEKTPDEAMWLSGYLLAKHGSVGAIPDGKEEALIDEYLDGFIAGLVSVGEYHLLDKRLVELLPLDTATLIINRLVSNGLVSSRLTEGVRA